MWLCLPPAALFSYGNDVDPSSRILTPTPPSRLGQDGWAMSSTLQTAELYPRVFNLEYHMFAGYLCKLPIYQCQFKCICRGRTWNLVEFRILLVELGILSFTGRSWNAKFYR